MAAKIITVANQKGGVGKTTVTMLLAGCLSKTWKAKVLVMDADRQRSAIEWLETSQEYAPFPADVIQIEKKLLESVHEEVRRYLNDYHYILIDCPPNLLSMPASALLVSDLVLVVTVPSKQDVSSTREFVKFVNEQMTENADLRAKLLLNKVEKNRRIASSFIKVIGALNMPVLPASFSRREFYNELSLYGATVYDFGRSKDIQELITESESVARAVVQVLSSESNNGINGN